MRQIISDAVVKTKAELKWAPTASDHITPGSSDHSAWGPDSGPSDAYGAVTAHGQRCCHRLPQRAEDSFWGLLGWSLCSICANKGRAATLGSRSWQWHTCLAPVTWPTKGYQAGFVMGPPVKQGKIVLSLFLLYLAHSGLYFSFLWCICVHWSWKGCWRLSGFSFCPKSYAGLSL